jgi:putative intracellular protease/amidase
MKIFYRIIFSAFFLFLLTEAFPNPFINIQKSDDIQSTPMTKTKQDTVKTIAFYLQDGVEILDFAGPMEVFTYAGYKVFTVSKTKEPIKAQRILKVLADYTIADAPKADILAFFGGNAGAAYKDKEVIEWIKSQTDVDYHFSVCTGAFMLAEAGILDNKVATTFHESLDNLQAEYPKVDVRKEVRFVDNGKEITTAGISAGIDGALHLVAKLQGLSAAKRTAYYMEYDNWVPGDGLILSDDNPYLAFPENDLREYEGTYEFKGENLIEIHMGVRSGELMVLIGDKKFPLFYEQADRFSDINGESVLFRRDQENRVLGYSLEIDGKIYGKK